MRTFTILKLRTTTYTMPLKTKVTHFREKKIKRKLYKRAHPFMGMWLCSESTSHQAYVK